MSLAQPLYGHTEPVTCVAVSAGYNFIVSGSRDRTCIIWDLSKLMYVRQLRGHTAPVAAVCINELTVSFYRFYTTCTVGDYLQIETNKLKITIETKESFSQEQW